MEKQSHQCQHSQIPCEASSLFQDGLKTPCPDAVVAVHNKFLGVFFICLLLSRPAGVVRSYLRVWLGGQSFCNFIRSLVVASVYSETCPVALFTPTG